MKKTVTFEYNIGDKVIIPGLSDAVGYVVSLWCTDRGEKYEVAYYCASERSEDYFLGVELKPFNGSKGMGFKKEKVCVKKEEPSGWILPDSKGEK